MLALGFGKVRVITMTWAPCAEATSSRLWRSGALPWKQESPWGCTAGAGGVGRSVMTSTPAVEKACPVSRTSRTSTDVVGASSVAEVAHGAVSMRGQ
jgi:hypothetical protein